MSSVQGHSRRLPYGNGGDCPTRKTPHRAPPLCGELGPPYDIKLVLCRKLHLFLGKSTKTAATRSAPFDSNMHQIVCRLELRPDPTGGAYSAPPDSLAVFTGPTASDGRGREKHGEEGERREFVLCPRKKKTSRRLLVQRQTGRSVEPFQHNTGL